MSCYRPKKQGNRVTETQYQTVFFNVWAYAFKHLQHCTLNTKNTNPRLLMKNVSGCTVLRSADHIKQAKLEKKNKEL